MRRIPLFWHNDLVGTIEVPDSFRPPITQAELDAIPCILFIRSRSWIYQVRPGDVMLQIRQNDGRDDVVAVATERMGPGDIGCILGFEPAPGHEHVRADGGLLDLADEVLSDFLGRRSDAV